MLKYLPIVLLLLISFTLTVTFSFAIRLKHVTYFIPFISDSGTFPPESCIFGLMLNFATIIIGAIIYVRHLQINEILNKNYFRSYNHFANQISFGVGLGICVGCSLVGNFQETVLMPVHFTGALLMFVGGAVYQGLQTFISFKTNRVFGNSWLNMTRLILSVISATSAVCFVVCGTIAGYFFRGADVTKWKTEDGGFEIHIVSSISEWICAGSTITFILCFFWDFKRITIKEPEIFIQDNMTVVITANLHD